jgi:hypothetical protein
MLEQIAQALERFGEEEMAARMRESQMRARLIEDIQFRQATGTMPGGGGGGGLNMGPEAGQPESTQRRSEVERAALDQRGMELVGSAGERAGV